MPRVIVLVRWFTVYDTTTIDTTTIGTTNGICIIVQCLPYNIFHPPHLSAEQHNVRTWVIITTVSPVHCLRTTWMDSSTLAIEYPTINIRIYEWMGELPKLATALYRYYMVL